MVVWKGCLVMEEKVELGGGNYQIYTPPFHQICMVTACSIECSGASKELEGEWLFCCLFIMSTLCSALVIEKLTFLCSWTSVGLDAMLILFGFHIPTFIS